MVFDFWNAKLGFLRGWFIWKMNKLTPCCTAFIANLARYPFYQGNKKEPENPALERVAGG